MRNVAVRASLVGLIVAASLSPATQGLPAADKPAPTNANASAATKPADPAAFDLFGPKLLGLGPGDEVRVVLRSTAPAVATRDMFAGNPFREELLLTADSPEKTHVWGSKVIRSGDRKQNALVMEDLGVIPSNANDWRRLDRWLDDCRTWRKPDSAAGGSELTVTLSSKGKNLRHERFICSENWPNSLVRELIDRARTANGPQNQMTMTGAGVLTQAQERPKPLATRSYPIGDILTRMGDPNDVQQLRTLVGLIYDIVDPVSWQPGRGGELRARQSGESQTLAITQTADAHREIGQLLALVRQAIDTAAAGKPSVCYGDPKYPEIAHTLAQRVSMDFDREPLGEVVKQLKTRYGLDVRLDPESTKDANVSEKTRITIHVRDISLQSAICLIFPRDPELAVENGALVIGYSPSLGRTLAFYPVGDLTGERKSAIIAPLDFVELVKSCCRPASWDDVGGDGSAHCVAIGKQHFLVVEHLHAAHQAVSGLLDALRIAQKQIEANPNALAAVRVFASPTEKAGYETINAALEKKISANIVEEPLEKVAMQLSRLSGVNVVIDRHAFQQVAVDEDVPVTLIAKNLDVRSALRELCDHCHFPMAWKIRDEVLFLTMPEEAEWNLPIVIYSFPEANSDELCDVIRSTVDPGSWCDVGGPGCATPLSFGKTAVLVISQTEHVHQEVAGLLTILRRIADDTAAGRPALRYGFDFPDGTPSNAAQKVLSKRVTLDIDKQPLDKTLRDLKQRFGLDLVLDQKAPEAHRRSDRPVTVHAKDVALGVALDELFRPLDLGWTLHDDSVTVTISEEAANSLNTAIFPIGDLSVCRDSAGALWDDYDSLIKQLTSEVAPDSWDAKDGSGSAAGFAFCKAKTLVVSQTDANLYRVADWLAKAHDARKQSPGSEPPLRQRPPKKSPAISAGS